MTDEETTPKPKDKDKEQAFQEQMKETAEVMRESSTILSRVTQKLNKAAADLQEYGDAPLEDLER